MTEIMITVSESAKEKLAVLMKEANAPADSFVRVGVESGGCSGLSYKMLFDTHLKP